MRGERYADRHEAGCLLAKTIAELNFTEPLVLALPRGGVPIGFEIAKALAAPLDVLLVRKIGSHHNPETGIGAVVEGLQPEVVLDQRAVALTQPPAGYIEAETQRQLNELERRRQHYRGGHRLPSLLGRTVIVADDGIATGGTMRAALKALARAGAHRLVLAVPVAPRDVLDDLTREVDVVVCPLTPEPFWAVGNHYDEFDQLADNEVLRLLDIARGNWAPPVTPASQAGAQPSTANR